MGPGFGDLQAGMAHIHAHSSIDDHTRSRRLALAFALTVVTLLVEAVGGWLSGSLALLADAGHMLVDALALLFAWLAVSLGQRPPDARRSFGYARLEVLVGYSNALIQFVLVAWIAIEAVGRLMHPAVVLSGLMLAVALAGLAVNALVLRVLAGHADDDVNTASARLHVLGDLFGSLGAVAAALVIHWLGWTWSDAVISLLVSVLILVSAWKLVRRASHILLEGAPEDIRIEDLGEAIRSCAMTVCNVHHVHVWQLAGGRRVATLHAQLVEGSDPDRAIRDIQGVLRERFRIAHATVQVERERCPAQPCDTRGGVD
jgi:cobalt-zinc-cadmium efflux system protein